MPLEYVKGVKFSLKENSLFDEAWIRDLVARDPSLLGLGRVRLLAVERTLPGAGRMDLLLESLPGDRRYVVELMLGRIDESHIVRCVEYWDLERRRSPRIEHVAVLAAEDMTSRFLNVLTLIREVVPVIALQMEAIRVGQQVLVNFVRILDELPPPPEPEPSPARREEQARRALLVRQITVLRKPPAPAAPPGGTLTRALPSHTSSHSPALRPLVRKSRDRGKY